MVSTSWFVLALSISGFLSQVTIELLPTISSPSIAWNESSASAPETIVSNQSNNSHQLRFQLHSDVTTSTQDPKELVEQLGDDEYANREDAEKRLQQMGGKALQALEDGRGHRDNEIRMRSQRLIRIIQRDDYQKRIKQFLSSQDAKKNFGLAGWDSYSKIAGSGQDARQLFVGMHRSEPELISAFGSPTAQWQNKFNQRLREIRIQLENQPSGKISGSIATLILIACQKTVGSLDPQNLPTVSHRNHQDITHLLSSQTVLRRLINEPGEKPLTHLVAHWIAQLPNDEASLLQSKVMLITRLNLSGFTEDAVEGATHTQLLPMERAKAIAYVANHGNASVLPAIEKLLQEETEVTGISVKNPLTGKTEIRKVQLRDIALAASIKLTQQSFQEFGYTLYEGNDDGFPPIIESTFQTEEQRENAFRKWKSGGVPKN